MRELDERIYLVCACCGEEFLGYFEDYKDEDYIPLCSDCEDKIRQKFDD